MMPRTFDDALWADLSAKISAAFSMDGRAAASFAANHTARLVAAIPFLAGCDHPERTALAHLATFVLASSASCRRTFDHEVSDDASPTARLAPIADFQGGDRKVIAQGLDLLAAIMANGYARDIAKDTKSGEYNPLVSGAWRSPEAQTLRAKDVRAESPAYSAIVSDADVLGFWFPD